MKKKIVFTLIAVFVLLVFLVLFFPFPQGPRYLDGGTREYKALTYKIVVWNRFIGDYDPYDPEGGIDDGIYHKTSVLWYPDNLLDINELWAREILSPEYTAREKAMEIAAKQCKKNYDAIYTRYIESNKTWEIEFWIIKTKTPVQTIVVDLEGNVVSDSYAE